MTGFFFIFIIHRKWCYYLFILLFIAIIDESSTMDEDMGGGEGVASSDDVNDISSAAQEVLSTGIRYLHILEVLVLLGFCLFLNWQIFQFKHSRSRGCRYIQQRPNRGYTDIFNRQRTGSITFILYHSTTATSK